MKILKCPNCDRIGGSLHFKPARIGTRLYPYVKHYDSSKKSRITLCNISASKLLQIEFPDSNHNAWKSVLDPKDWYKITDLASRYSNIDLYLNRTESDKLQEETVKMLKQEKIILEKFRRKIPEIVEFWKRDKKAFDEIMSNMKNLIKIQESLQSDNIILKPGNHYVHIKTSEMMNRLRLYLYLPMKLENLSISKKQLNEFKKGHTRQVPDILEPKTRDEALVMNFQGMQCPKCKSWRTDLAPDGIEFKCKCYACDARFERGIISKCPQCHLPFFDEIIKNMKQNSIEITDDVVITRCIRCENEVSLSLKHIEIIHTCKWN